MKIVNKKVENKKAEVDGMVAILVIYTCFIIINDWICYLFAKNANLLIYASSFFIVSVIVYLLNRVVKLKFDKFQKYDLIFIGFIIFIYIQRLAIPEKAFDTLNYHLYMQERPFADNISFNFFPARWINSYTFPLADRMHYFFRFLLGYRLGNILNIFILVILYYQSKRFLEIFLKKENNSLIPILAIIVITTEQILTNSMNYYVDLIAIPFILEIILIIMEKKFNHANHYMVLLMAGIIVAMKVSNALILIPLAIVYIMYSYQTLNIKIILVGIILAILPIFVYALNNYLQTGNPVFPFYNSIFKSEYLPNTNWIEEFYGPKTLLERITWPINAMYTPRRAFDTEIYYGRIGIGYIAAIILLVDSIIYSTKNKKINQYLEISLIYIVLALIWSNFMMGYVRYALFLEILAGVIILILLAKYFTDQSFIKIAIAVFISIMLIHQIDKTLNDATKTAEEYSWRYPKNINEEKYRANLKEIFKKYDYEKELEGIDCFAICDYNSGYAALLSNEIPIISLLESYHNDFGKKQFEQILEKYADKRIFTITTTETKERTLKYLEQTDFELKGEIRQFKTEFIDVENEIILMEIVKNKKEE